jgi:hypothetical protein
MFGFNNNTAQRYNKLSSKWKKNAKPFNPGSSFYNSFGCKVSNQATNDLYIDQLYGPEQIPYIKNSFLQISKLQTQKRVATSGANKRIISDRKIGFMKLIPVGAGKMPTRNSVYEDLGPQAVKKPAIPSFRIRHKSKSLKKKPDPLPTKFTEPSEEVIGSYQNLKLIQMDVW